MSTTKPILYFDCDGFLFDTIPAHIDYLYHKYGFTATRKDFHDSPKLHTLVKKYHPLLDISYEQVYQDLGKNFIASKEWHDNVKPMPGMPEVIHKLSKYYDMYIATARPISGSGVVEMLVDTFIPDTISGYHYVWRENKNNGWDYFAKKDFIDSHISDVEKVAFFDDTLREVVDVQPILPAYLFDHYKWYTDDPRVAQHHIKLVHSWKEIGEFLLAPVA